MIQTPADIKKLGSILGVWAHPDDETFVAAGVLAAAVRNGQKVACVTATRGEAGSQDIEKWPPESLGKVREKELKKALDILGIKSHQFLNYIDGQCEQIPAHEAVDKIEAQIKQHQPDTILTFGPEGMTGHPDHMCVSSWTQLAVNKISKKPAIYHVVHTTDQYEQYLKQLDEKLNIFFNIDKPPLLEPHQCDIYFELGDEFEQIKYEALKSQPSQTEIMTKLFSKDMIKKSLSPEAFVLVKNKSLKLPRTK